MKTEFKLESAWDTKLLCILLLVDFVHLKLSGVIAWSWWWVLAPLWMPLVAVVLVIGSIFGLKFLVNKFG